MAAELPKVGDKVNVDGKPAEVVAAQGVNALVKTEDGKTILVPLTELNKG